jgi:hypothetical protein
MTDREDDFDGTLVWGLGEVKHGNDSTPLMNIVRDPAYCRGTLTSESRTASREYMAFLERNRDGRK